MTLTPLTLPQEYYLGRVSEALEVAEAQSRGTVVLLHTGGAQLSGAAYSAVSPAATVSVPTYSSPLTAQPPTVELGVHLSDG